MAFYCQKAFSKQSADEYVNHLRLLLKDLISTQIIASIYIDNVALSLLCTANIALIFNNCQMEKEIMSYFFFDYKFLETVVLDEKFCGSFFHNLGEKLNLARFFNEKRIIHKILIND